jgi:hypothetical protein
MEETYSSEMEWKTLRYQVNNNCSENLETCINNFDVHHFHYIYVLISVLSKIQVFWNVPLCHWVRGFWLFIVCVAFIFKSNLSPFFTDWLPLKKDYNPSKCQEPSSHQQSTTLCTTQNARSHPTSNKAPHSAPLKMPGTILPSTKHHTLHHSKCQEPSSHQQSTTPCTTQNARNHPPINKAPYSAPLKMPGTILSSKKHHILRHSNPHPACTNSDNLLYYMWTAQGSAWPTNNTPL